MPTTLIITNDFPPRIGGIESFVADLCDLLNSDVVVLTSESPNAAAYDRTRSFEVVRRNRVLLPTRSTVGEARRLLASRGATRVIFGAAAPLSLMAPALRSAGASHLLAITHGHETWWSGVTGARQLLHRMGEGVDHLSTISDYVEARIAPALSSSARLKIIRLAPPVDPAVFRPGRRVDHARPTCIAAGRFVTRKGFGTLLDAWSLAIRNGSWPTTPELVLIGDGPLRTRLQTRVDQLGLADSVRFVGSIPRAAVVGHLQQADVFALPVRTRLGGLDPEGLGLAFLEAAACGLPVIVGDSGGAPETVQHGLTGFVVDPSDAHALAARLNRLLTDRELATSMGAAGREFVSAKFGTDRAGSVLRTALGLSN